MSALDPNSQTVPPSVLPVIDRMHVPAALVATFLKFRDEAERGRDALARLEASEAARRDAEKKLAAMETARRRSLHWLAALDKERRDASRRLVALKATAVSATTAKSELEAELVGVRTEAEVSRAQIESVRKEAVAARLVAREATEVAQASHRAAQAAVTRLATARKHASELGFWGRLGTAWKFLARRPSGSAVVLLLPEHSSAPKGDRKAA